MVEPEPLDSAWLKAHPLPSHADDVDKNGRGAVLVIGGSKTVPGGIMLTAEAAFRAGAGKVTIATGASAAQAIGIAFPECAVIALPESASGELEMADIDLLAKSAASAGAIVVGPAMTCTASCVDFLADLLVLVPEDTSLVLDAAAIRAAPKFRDQIVHRDGPVVMTPHAGEMRALLADSPRLEPGPLGDLALAVELFSSTIMIKGPTTYVSNGEDCLAYAGGGIGLATGGSGDVLAGLIAALGAQGAAPLTAAAWGIWLHGEAGRRLSETTGPLGYLAREILPLIPSLIAGSRR